MITADFHINNYVEYIIL